MKDNKAKTENVFGNVSDFQGVGTGGSKCENIPENAEHYVPHYHDGEQIDPTTVVVSNHYVTEKELSSHF